MCSLWIVFPKVARFASFIFSDPIHTVQYGQGGHRNQGWECFDPRKKFNGVSADVARAAGLISALGMSSIEAPLIDQRIHYDRQFAFSRDWTCVFIPRTSLLHIVFTVDLLSVPIGFHLPSRESPRSLNKLRIFLIVTRFLTT